MTKIKKDKKKHNPVNVVICLILFIVLVLTIGFSSYQDDIKIGFLGAVLRVDKDIRITGISVSGSTNGAISNYEEYDVNYITTALDLPNEDSTITYDIPITNLGNIEMGIFEITGLPSNLKWTLSGYNLGDMLCDDSDNSECSLGSITTLHLTIGYDTNGYDSTNTLYAFDVNFTISPISDKVAKMGDTYYDTLQLAIDDVKTKDPVTIILLKNTSEIISVTNGKNIIFDFRNNTLSNSGNNPVISNRGNISISNGTITSNASTQGAINNESTGVINITGGRVIVTGGRQALYNNKGKATISGGAYLTSKSTQRAAVQNVAGGTMTILGGTIISTGFSGVVNAGVMTVGTKDGTINDSSPMIQGVTYGIEASSNFKFYDGILKGKTSGLNNASRITEMEDGFGLISDEEIIDSEIYKISYLGVSSTVNFNPNGGTLDETIRYVSTGHKIGELPVPVKAANEFDGWYTLSSGGLKISENTIINSDITFYAHWNKITNVARIGDKFYDSLQDAVIAVKTNTPTTIVLLKDTQEKITVGSQKIITFDLTDKTLSNFSNNAVIENNGNTTIIGGRITSNADTGAINNNATGVFNISGGEIIATGSRQAIYNIAGGVVNISGGYMSSKTSGRPTNANIDRATVQNLEGGILNITGGTIEGIVQQAVANEGTLTIGTKDGTVNGTFPNIIGATFGLESTGTLNFYDGIIKGKQNPVIKGEVTDLEENYSVKSGTETIDGTTYITSYLDLNS